MTRLGNTLNTGNFGSHTYSPERVSAIARRSWGTGACLYAARVDESMTGPSRPRTRAAAQPSGGPGSGPGQPDC